MVKELSEWVKNKLTRYPRLRDSNERLYYNYLKENGYDTGKSIKEFLKDMENRKIPYMDSLSRASRKVQEECAQLRGIYYGKRKKKAKEIKHEIRNM